MLALNYNISVNTSNKLITDYRFELIENHHSPGGGRYGGRVIVPTDISTSFYDYENRILIGGNNRRRYTLRPPEIQAGIVTDPSGTPSIVKEAVEPVNRVWREHEDITRSFRERKLPTVYAIYRLLPGTDCKECGYSTCLACTACIRNGVISLERCPLLSKPEYTKNKEQIHTSFFPGQTND